MPGYVANALRILLEGQKEAASRLDREIRAGNLQYHDIDPSIPQGRMPAVLEPVAKQKSRAALAAPAAVAPSALARRQELNDRITKAQLAASGEALGVPGATMSGQMMMGMGPATMGTTVHTDQNAGRFARSIVRGPIGQIQAVAGTMDPSLLPSARPVDGTLNRAIFQHELGEAAEMKRPVVAPHASHFGVEPIVREQLATVGDPEAVQALSQMRQMHPDDRFVQKAVRSVGGTPDSPIPLGGRQHRALDRIMARSGEELSPLARGRSLAVAAGGKTVSHMPASVRDFAKNIPNVAQQIGGEATLLGKARAALPYLSRVRQYVNRGV